MSRGVLLVPAAVTTAVVSVAAAVAVGIGATDVLAPPEPPPATGDYQWPTPRPMADWRDDDGRLRPELRRDVAFAAARQCWSTTGRATMMGAALPPDQARGLCPTMPLPPDERAR